jgi:hypothetical protein
VILTDRQSIAAKIAAGVSGLGLVGWGGYAIWQNTPAPLVEGTVVERDFTPAHWEDYLRPVTRTRQASREVCTGGYGDVPRSCHTEYYTETYTDYVPDTRWVDDDWDLIVSGCSLDRQGDEHCRNENIDVSEQTYDNCRTGMTWRQETACRPQ